MNRIPRRWADRCRRRTSGIRRNNGVKLWAVIIWITVWFAVSGLIGNGILLASPVDVLKRMLVLIRTADFWMRALKSYMNVLAGLLLGAAGGIVLGVVSGRYRLFEELIKPLIAIMRTVPVASFIILALVWMGKERLSVFISAIICLPVFYTNTLEGLSAADMGLIEMAQVYRLGFAKRVKALYLPALLPFVRSAFSASVGLAWKSAIAAEVIAVPGGSVGEMLYYAKVWLETADLMCWTLLVVLLSSVTGYIINRLLGRWARAYE